LLFTNDDEYRRLSVVSQYEIENRFHLICAGRVPTMAHTKDRLVLLLLALAIGGAYLAIRYDIQWIISLMIGAGGVFMLFRGLQMIASGKARVPTQGSDLNPRVEHHWGFTARLWGILYAMMALALFGIAYGMWPLLHGDADLIGSISKSPFLSSLLLLVVGAGIAMYGLTRLLAPKEAFVETGASTAGRYFMGAYTCLLGGLILAVGLVRAFAPELLSTFSQWVRDLIENGVRQR
jgi:hypothetical protein